MKRSKISILFIFISVVFFASASAVGQVEAAEDDRHCVSASLRDTEMPKTVLLPSFFTPLAIKIAASLALPASLTFS
jgi:hypothetical protein